MIFCIERVKEKRTKKNHQDNCIGPPHLCLCNCECNKCLSNPILSPRRRAARRLCRLKGQTKYLFKQKISRSVSKKSGVKNARHSSLQIQGMGIIPRERAFAGNKLFFFFLGSPVLFFLFKKTPNPLNTI